MTTARYKGLTFTRERLVGVGAILLLLLLGVVLPYLTLQYVNPASELVRETKRLLDGSELIGGIDPTYLPGYTPEIRSDMTLGLNTMSAAMGLQQVASLVAAVTVAGQFFDEINKFFWWPLHLAGYLLVIIPIPLLIGQSILRGQGIDIDLGPGWVPATLAGAVALVMTFRSYKRLDTYGGI